MWRRIKDAFTRVFREPNEAPTWVYVRWYSKHSNQWSKWRKVRKDFMDSDHELYVRLSHGQKIELAFEPYDTAVKKGDLTDADS